MKICFSLSQIRYEVSAKPRSHEPSFRIGSLRWRLQRVLTSPTSRRSLILHLLTSKAIMETGNACGVCEKRGASSDLTRVVFEIIESHTAPLDFEFQLVSRVMYADYRKQFWSKDPSGELIRVSSLFEVRVPAPHSLPGLIESLSRPHCIQYGQAMLDQHTFDQQFGLAKMERSMARIPCALVALRRLDHITLRRDGRPWRGKSR